MKAGVRTLSVTDHDTMAAVPEVCEVGAAAGADVVSGIEMTAVSRGRDVHILGYFPSATPPGLEAFLTVQRRHRTQRLRAIASRLALLGAAVDVDALVATRGAGGQSLGRPHLARALVQAGHAASIQEAFDRWLGDGKAAWVARQGSAPERVIRAISDAGGIASLAHPGLSRGRRLLRRLAEQGLHAVEVFHSQHDSTTQQRLLEDARALRLMVTGGSDFHGDSDQRAGHLGRVGLPPEHFEALRDRLAAARRRLEPSYE